VVNANRGAAVMSLLGLAAALLVSPAPVAAATNAPEYGVRAGLSGATTLTKNHFAYALPQGGAVIHDSVIVSNYTDAPITFDVHGADMIAAQGGGLAPAAEDAKPALVGAWLAVEGSPLVIPAHRETSAAFTLTVPAAQKAGEYTGAVVVARRSTEASGVRVLTRAALTVEVTVLGQLDLRAAAGPLTGSQQHGEEHFTLTVANTGNVLFTFTGTVTVRDGSGKTLATIPVAPSGIYVIPGGHADVTAVWSGVPLWGEATATATVQAKPASGTGASFQSGALHLSFFTWALPAGAAAGVLAAGIAFLLISRRRRRERQAGALQAAANS
jgi:hypothetical protein